MVQLTSTSTRAGDATLIYATTAQRHCWSTTCEGVRWKAHDPAPHVEGSRPRSRTRRTFLNGKSAAARYGDALSIDTAATAAITVAIAAITVAAPLPRLPWRRPARLVLVYVSRDPGCDPGRQRVCPLIGCSFAGRHGVHPWGSVRPVRSAFVPIRHVWCRPLGARHPLWGVV